MVPEPESWRIVYLAGTRAPAALVRSVESEVEAAVQNNGITVSEAPETEDPRPAVEQARTRLDRGVAEFTQLKLDEALSSLRSAEAQAHRIMASADAARIVFAARLHRARILLAQGKEDEARSLLRQAALNGPPGADRKQFPPDVVEAYAAAREEVLETAGTGTLRVTVTPSDASVAIDGIPWQGKPVTLFAGPHVVSGIAQGRAPTGIRIQVEAGQETAADLFLPRAESAAIGQLRSAWRKGDPAGAAEAASRLASATASTQVLGWDLRSRDGQVQALLVLIDSEAATAPPPKVVALPAGAAGARQPLEAAIARMISPTVASEGDKKSNRKVWYWTAAAVGAAVLAGGGVAIAAKQGPTPNGDVTIVISR